MSELVTNSHPARSHKGRTALLAAAGICLGGELFASRNYPVSQDPSHSASVESALIDPNLAPWWELGVLPRVGESLARRIVEYRERVRIRDGNARPFRRPEDLR